MKTEICYIKFNSDKVSDCKYYETFSGAMEFLTEHGYTLITPKTNIDCAVFRRSSEFFTDYEYAYVGSVLLQN